MAGLVGTSEHTSSSQVAAIGKIDDEILGAVSAPAGKGHLPLCVVGQGILRTTMMPPLDLLFFFDSRLLAGHEDSIDLQEPDVLAQLCATTP